MSAVRASIFRKLEEVVERIIGVRIAHAALISIVLGKIVLFGNHIESLIALFAKTTTDYLLKLQKSLERSVLMASLWTGLLLSMALLIVALIASMGVALP
ncbi:MAG: hypothetical protein N3E36_01055 [Sulfolobales archaeon]|nr:hypothetical protein [Sulfolobales archaeon]MCX8198605.1 hypothetical protein [Sulfolobales archaeon]MDW8169679.1 hypothetical protein [Desulfurococcaceae archaeon]